MGGQSLEEVLANARAVAVVGLSDKPHRASCKVASYLLDAGYEIIPVNANIGRWKGRKSYPGISDIPQEIIIDIVDVFRRSEFAPKIAGQALLRKPRPKLIWLQEGVVSREAMEMAQKQGVLFVQNACIMVRHQEVRG